METLKHYCWKCKCYNLLGKQPVSTYKNVISTRNFKYRILSYKIKINKDMNKDTYFSIIYNGSK